MAARRAAGRVRIANWPKRYRTFENKINVYSLTAVRACVRSLLNVLARRFDVDAPDRAWVTDITYVWTREGWLYLAVVIDLFNRMVVGLSIGPRISYFNSSIPSKGKVA